MYGFKVTNQKTHVSSKVENKMAACLPDSRGMLRMMLNRDKEQHKAVGAQRKYENI